MLLQLQWLNFIRYNRKTNVKLEKDKQSMHHTNGVGLPSVNTLNNSWCVVMKSQAPLEASLMSRGEERWRLPHSQRNINRLCSSSYLQTTPPSITHNHITEKQTFSCTFVDLKIVCLHFIVRHLIQRKKLGNCNTVGGKSPFK